MRDRAGFQSSESPLRNCVYKDLLGQNQQLNNYAISKMNLIESIKTKISEAINAAELVLTT